MVLFHGLQPGNYAHAYEETWTCKTDDGNTSCSLQDCIAKDFPEARILAVSYDSSARQQNGNQGLQSWNVVQEQISSALYQAHAGKVPLVFVGHSLGGLVMQQVYLEIERRSRLRSTPGPGQVYTGMYKLMLGMFYYGTPHLGSRLADLALALTSLLPWPLRNYAKPGIMMQYITTLSSYAAPGAKAFTELITTIPDFRLEAVYETIPERWGSFNAIVVEQAAATAGMHSSTCLGSCHTQLCKPSSSSDPRYTCLKEFLKTVCGVPMLWKAGWMHREPNLT